MPILVEIMVGREDERRHGQVHRPRARVRARLAVAARPDAACRSSRADGEQLRHAKADSEKPEAGRNGERRAATAFSRSTARSTCWRRWRARRARGTEIAARTGLVVSTAHRLLATLVERGYAAQNPATVATARLQGARARERAAGAARPRCGTAARPHLERIQRATGETTNLVILEADRVVYVDQVEGSHSIRMFTELGSACPAHTTGSGKAMLACRPRRASRLYPREREPFERLTAAHAHDARRRCGGLHPHPPARLRPRQRGARGGRELRRDAGIRRQREACAAISISAPTARIVHADTDELGQPLE